MRVVEFYLISLFTTQIHATTIKPRIDRATSASSMLETPQC
jgi:hypothetical protein